MTVLEPIAIPKLQPCNFKSDLKPILVSRRKLFPAQGPVKVDGVEKDPSPTALRSPLSPWRGIKFKILALSLGERGDRKAEGAPALCLLWG